MPSNEALIAVLPWLAVLGPFAGLVLVYLVIPRLYSLLGTHGVAVLVFIAITIIVLLEVRP